MRARLVLALLPFVVLIAMSGGCGEDVTQPVDDDPTIDAIEDTTVVLGDTLLGQVVASDDRSDPLTYTMTVLPADAAGDYVAKAGIDPITGEFWFVPGDRDLPGRTLRFTVSDDGGNAVSTDQHVTVTYYVDQSNQWDLAMGSGGINVVYAAPVGQEFTPASRALDVVELRLNGANGPGQVLVRIRDESISGPVLAESESLELPGIDEYFVALFHFDRVTLTPEHLYVLEIVPVDGAAFMATRGADLYPRGREILFGSPHENADLWFRVGTLPRPAPVLPPDGRRPHTDESGAMSPVNLQ